MNERKLIYADDAIEAIEEITWYHQNINNEMVRGANSSEDQAWYKAEDVYEALEQLPSVQPEIIRCRDCKHNRRTRDSGNANCELYYGMTDQMGFYHMGERRDG